MADLAAEGVDAIQINTAVEVRGSTCGKIGDPILNQDAAVDGPCRLELAKGTDASVLRGGTKAPNELSISGAETVNPPVGRTEDDRAAVVGWRRIDPAPGYRLPNPLTVRGIQRYHTMFINQRQKDATINHGRLGDCPSNLFLPQQLRRIGHSGLDSPAPQRIMPVGGPVGGACVAALRFAIGGASFEASGLFMLGSAIARRNLWGQRHHAVQLLLN